MAGTAGRHQAAIPAPARSAGRAASRPSPGLPCTGECPGVPGLPARARALAPPERSPVSRQAKRSEEHTSELQSRRDLVCRLLLEKKKINIVKAIDTISSAKKGTVIDKQVVTS